MREMGKCSVQCALAVRAWKRRVAQKMCTSYSGPPHTFFEVEEGGQRVPRAGTKTMGAR